MRPDVVNIGRRADAPDSGTRTAQRLGSEDGEPQRPPACRVIEATPGLAAPVLSLSTSRKDGSRVRGAASKPFGVAEAAGL